MHPLPELPLAETQLTVTASMREEGFKTNTVLSCSPLQDAGTEIPGLFLQAIQYGRRWAGQEARS